jgi:hypothetical protein
VEFGYQDKIYRVPVTGRINGATLKALHILLENGRRRGSSPSQSYRLTDHKVLNALRRARSYPVRRTIRGAAVRRVRSPESVFGSYLAG